MNGQNVQSIFSQIPILKSLSEGEMIRLSQIAERRLVPKHGYIYLADEPSDFICILASGSVKVGIYSPDGREIIKNIQHPYSVFGELGLTGENKRSDFACAMSRDVDVFLVRVDDFKALMQQNFKLSQAIMVNLGERLQRAERHWESLILKDVRTRIVEFLKESAGARGRQVGYETMVKHSLTQQDIANLVGASRQTVTAILNELKKSNLIHFNRNTILIRDMDKLN